MFIALPDFLFVTSASKEGKLQQSYCKALHGNRHEIRGKTWVTRRVRVFLEVCEKRLVCAFTMSTVSRRGVRGTLSSTLHKWRNALRKLTYEVLSKIEERSYGEEDKDVDDLFRSDSLGHSGESITLAGTSTDMRLAVETEDDNTDETKVSKQTTAREGHGRIPFEEYDAVSECAKLRRETGEPFYQGSQIWLRRRELWTQPAATNSINDSIKRSRKFSKISSQSYIKIYKKLSIDDKSLREPLNLKDALKVVDAGWKEVRRCEEAEMVNGVV